MGTHLLQMGTACFFKRRFGEDRQLTGSASGDLSEVSELYLERNGSPASAGALAVTPDLVDDVPQLIPRRVVGDEIYRKRVLGTDGFPYPIGPDGPLE
jgi:hypothetical protein